MADLELLQSRQVAQNFQQRIGKGASLEFDDLDRSRVVHDDVRAGIRDRQKGGALCRIGSFGLALVPEPRTARIPSRLLADEGRRNGKQHDQRRHTSGLVHRLTPGGLTERRHATRVRAPPEENGPFASRMSKARVPPPRYWIRASRAKPCCRSGHPGFDISREWREPLPGKRPTHSASTSITWPVTRVRALGAETLTP